MRVRDRALIVCLAVAACCGASVAVGHAAGQAAPAQAGPAIHVQPIQGNVYMLVGGGANVLASVGPDGILLVDTGTSEAADNIKLTALQLATLVAASPQPNRCLGQHCPRTPFGWVSPELNAIIDSPAPPKPVRFIINTNVDPDHVGGNEKLAALPKNSKLVGVTFPPVSVAPSAQIIAHENVLNRMSEPAKGDPTYGSEALPTVTFHGKDYKLSQFFNGEGVIMYSEPAAHSDGDIVVFFRYSDVIAAGDILNTESYPVIDVGKGGSLQGVLDGLNNILDLAIPEFRSQGGTLIIPGHGRICDTGDVANYRNMIAIIRDRITDMIKRGMTLEQVQAARPTLEYDGLYGSTSGPWTTAKFVEAAYRSLSPKKSPGSTQTKR